MANTQEYPEQIWMTDKDVKREERRGLITKAYEDPETLEAMSLGVNIPYYPVIQFFVKKLLLGKVETFKILDAGAGTGDVDEMLLTDKEIGTKISIDAFDSHPMHTILLTERSERLKKAGRELNILPAFDMMNPSVIGKNKYDFIMFNYSSTSGNIEEIIKKYSEMLNPGGELFFIDVMKSVDNIQRGSTEDITKSTAEYIGLLAEIYGSKGHAVFSTLWSMMKRGGTYSFYKSKGFKEVISKFNKEAEENQNNIESLLRIKLRIQSLRKDLSIFLNHQVFLDNNENEADAATPLMHNMYIMIVKKQ